MNVEPRKLLMTSSGYSTGSPLEPWPASPCTPSGASINSQRDRARWPFVAGAMLETAAQREAHHVDETLFFEICAMPAAHEAKTASRRRQ